MKKIIERKQYLQELQELKEQNVIKVITGVRRCGKSTLMNAFAEELKHDGVSDQQIHLYNFEDPDVFTIGDWKNIYDHIKVKLIPDQMNYVFLDEVQNVDTFQRLVDGLYIKPNVDLYVTGSNAFLLYKVPRYEIKGKGLLKTLNKYYLVDPCFSKVRLQRKIHQDRSHRLENVVFLELLRRYRNVHVGKIGDKEVDFVVVDQQGYTAYFQVAWTVYDHQHTLSRELAPLHHIHDSNPKFLLTMDNDFNPVYNGIRQLNAADWLLQQIHTIS